MWDKQGLQVKANYHGKYVTGVVTDSRVKYGGTVQHTITLDAPIMVRWRSEPVYTVLVDDSNVVAS
jgi:hypothetical protein